MKSLTAILKPVVLKEDAENACDDAFACLDEIITMCTNLQEGLQTVEGDMDESMMNCISSTREHIKSACECALEAYGFDACCDTCKDGEEEEEVKEAKMKDILPTEAHKTRLMLFMNKLNALRKDFPEVIIRGYSDETVEAGLLDKKTGNVIKIGEPIDFTINKSEKDMGISKDNETKFHKKLDDLVHSTFGKRKDENVELEESFRPGYDMVPAPIGKDTYNAKGLRKLWGTKTSNGKWADYYVAMYDDGKIGIVNQQGVNKYSTVAAFKKGFEKFRENGDLDESMNEATGAHSMGTATVTFTGSRLNGKKVDIFHKFPDGRINVQYRKSDKKGDVINLTLKKGQYELNEAESKQKTHMITMWLEKTLKVLEKIVKDVSINAVEHGNLEKGVRYIISATKGTPFEEEFKKLSDLGHGREYDKALIKLLTDIQDYYVDMNEAVSQKVKIGSKVKGIMGVHGRSQGTVVRFGSDRGKKIVYVKSPDGKEWNTTEYNIRVVDKLDEAKKIDEPEEAGLKDYVMPKSVTKMLAKHQYNRVKAGTKLFDAVSKVDKNKDLLHLYTSKKHKNILIGMFMVGKKASYFIHDTEAKSQRLDNTGRYKDLKGFTTALTAKFEGSEKNESAKKPLTKILGEATDTKKLGQLFRKHEFEPIPKNHEIYKQHNKDGKTVSLYGIPMRAGKYADILIGITLDTNKDRYFVVNVDKNGKSVVLPQKTATDVISYLKSETGLKENNLLEGSKKK